MIPPRAAIICRILSGLSGARAMVLEHARRLTESGWRVDVYAEKFDSDILRGRGAFPRRVLPWPWGSYLKRRVFAAQADWRARRGGYDVVHGHGDSLGSDILSLHNCVHAAHEAVSGEVLPAGRGAGRMHARILSERRFKILIANSRLMQDEVVGRFGVSASAVRVAYPGYDPARFNLSGRLAERPRARRSLGYGPEDFVFGLATSGDFAKRGVSLFLKALGEVRRRRGEGVHGLVVGKESRMELYQRQAVSEGLTGCVRFLAPAPDVERYYGALDVFVYPALYEEFGISMLEAMGCGLPVVTSRRTGAAELLERSYGDFLLEKPEAGLLAQRMEELMDNVGLRERLSALAHQAAKGCTWDRHWEVVSGIYEQCRR